MTTTTTEHPLAPEVIARIEAQHARRVGDHVRPVVTDETVLYRPSDGTCLGSDHQPDAVGVDHSRFVSVNSSRLPEPDELAAIRITQEGTVLQPQSLLRWRRHEPEPEPEPAPMPARRVSHVGPLNPHCRMVVASQHLDRVPREIREPGLGRAMAFTMPEARLAYHPVDGRLLGDVTQLPPEADASRLIVLSTHELPDAKLDRLVVQPDGTVTEVTQ